MHKPGFFTKFVLVVLLIFSAGVRMVGVFHPASEDMRLFLIPWYDTLAAHGFKALAQPFSNYTPPYLYLLWLVTLTQTWIPKTIAIKLISIAFDIGSGFVIYQILKIKHPQGEIPFLGASLFFALPTVFLNSSFWGQSDAIYTFFLLISLYQLLRSRPVPAVIAFGVAFAFKAQAIFFVPFLLLLTFKKHIPRYLYWLVPLVYAGMMVPAMMVGRPILDLMGIYLNQADAYHRLSMNAPNIYLLIPGSLYSPVAAGGLVVAGLIIMIWVIFYAQKAPKDPPEFIILCAAVSALMLPFLLPKMHERYFYLSDVLLLLLAFYLPRVWFLPVVSQFVSILTYSVYLFLEPEAAWQMIVSFMLLAILSNAALVLTVIRTQYKLMVLEPGRME